VESGGEVFTLEGNEVILSAGAIASPQLLMLSGVGPQEHLLSLGIPVVYDSPGVGQNLRDHPNIRVPLEVHDDFPMDPKAPRSQTALRYTAEGSTLRNDMQLMASSFSSPIAGDPLESEGIRFTCILELANGSGEVTLASTDPNDQPNLSYHYLEDPFDLQRLREAVRLCVRFQDHEDYKKIVKRRIAPTDEDLATDETLDAWLKRNVSTSQHLAGTCKMGPSSDKTAVVDQYCRVHGLQGLRVVDTSVMPNVVRANTNATAIMIAERVADWMK